MSQEKDIERLLIENACVSIIMRYADAVNRGDYEGFAELFTTDAVWQRPVGEPMVGRESIKDFLRPRFSTDRLIRHVNGGYVIEVIDAENAKGVNYTTVYETTKPATALSPEITPNLVVEYKDRYRRTAEGWKIARRDTTVLFARDPAGFD